MTSCEAGSEGPIYSAATSPLLQLLQMLLLLFAGWLNARQLDVIEHLQEENRVLKERMGLLRPEGMKSARPRNLIRCRR
jgi:hypothetical protein